MVMALNCLWLGAQLGHILGRSMDVKRARTAYNLNAEWTYIGRMYKCAAGHILFFCLAI